MMKEFLNITKALADESRLRLLMALRGGEVCVCQIAEFSGLAMSTVSKHLSVLYQAGLVNARKEGRWMYYSLPGKGTPTAAREAVAWVQRSPSRLAPANLAANYFRCFRRALPALAMRCLC